METEREKIKEQKQAKQHIALIDKYDNSTIYCVLIVDEKENIKEMQNFIDNNKMDFDLNCELLIKEMHKNFKFTTIYINNKNLEM